MAIVLNGTTGITNDGGYTGDGIVFADTTPANTLVTTTGGNVGIGTSSPDSRIHAQRADDGTIATFRGTSNAQLLLGIASGNLVYDASNGNATHVFQGNGNERMRIDSSGNLLVGATSNPQGDKTLIAGNLGVATGNQINFTPSASTIEFVNRASGGARTFSWYYGASGGGAPATLSTSGVWTNASDVRGKENITDISYGLAAVSLLKPRQYDVKSDGSHRIGFVAQELVEHVPEVVHVSMTDKDGSDWYGVDYGSIAAVLVKAIQEQQAIITALTARVEALEGAQA
jgi:hypothetical protein